MKALQLLSRARPSLKVYLREEEFKKETGFNPDEVWDL